MEFGSSRAVARLSTLYTGVDIVRQRSRTLDLLSPMSGAVCLDVGCGPGLLAVDLANRVGDTGWVAAIDTSASMVNAAQRRAEEADLADTITATVADAAAIPYKDGCIDNATAVQVLEYVPDVGRALAEFSRVLRPGGRLLVIDTDWRSCVWASSDRQRTDRVLRAWEDHFVHPHLPTRLVTELQANGFSDVTVEIIPIINLAPSTDAFSRGMADTIAGWLHRRETVAGSVIDEWREDVLSHAPYFFSLCRYAYLATRATVLSQ